MDETKPRVTLSGTDGNAFSILARVQQALRDAGQQDRIETFLTEAMDGDYDHLLRVCMTYAEVE